MQTRKIKKFKTNNYNKHKLYNSNYQLLNINYIGAEKGI